MLEHYHQFAKPVVLMFLYFRQHEIKVCSLMLLFTLCCISVISLVEPQKCMNKPLPLYTMRKS